MFIAHFLSSIASFLFPIFASYKALKTSDPAQLTPWLMYWVVFSCFLLAESWVGFVLSWIPLYSYVRLLFLLYLVLPQTQGARLIYEEHVHPFLESNETEIDDFIASTHRRLKAESLAYIRQAIEYVRTNVLGLAPSPAPPEPTETQTYTQALLARFSVPAAKWTGSANTGADFYNLLAGAVAAASGAAGSLGGGSAAGPGRSGLIPSNLQSSSEKMTFIAAQRDRLNFILSALDKEAQNLQGADTAGASHSHGNRAPSMSYDGTEDDEPTQRPPSVLSMGSSIKKNRSEADFETIDADSLAEDDAAVRRRNATTARGSWMPWNWGAGGSVAADTDADAGTGVSSGLER